MARLTIEDQWWTDPRRERLAKLVGSPEFADGVAVRAWRLAQEYWKRGRGMVPKALFDALEHAQVLLGCGLAEERGDLVYVRGSSNYHEWAAAHREHAAVGGKVSAKRARDAQGRLTKKPKQTPSETQVVSKMVQPSASASASASASVSASGSGTDSGNFPNDLPVDRRGRTVATWEAYRKAYRERYKTDPVRNKTVNGMLAKLVEKLGLEEAPLVAEFYVTHNQAFYVGAMHPVNLLVRDAEKLRTEWFTGRRMTNQAAREGERQDVHADQLRRIAEGSL